MRDYGEDTTTIWGGNKDCEHTWIDDDKKAGYCSKCGARKGQLGLEKSPEEYITHLRMVFAEVKRVLKKTGTCWVNIGDSYAGSSKGIGSSPDPKWEKARNDNMKHKTDWDEIDLPAKCMCMIPERFAFMMLDLGYILRNKIIWKKPNSMPSSVSDRFNTTWEYVYFFTKNNKPVYYYNDKSGAMVDKKPTTQVEGVDWDWRKPKLKKVSHWHSVSYFFDLDAVREPYTEPLNRWGGNEVKIPKKTKWKSNDEKAKWCMSIGDRQSRPNPSGKNPGDVFVINTEPYPDAHFATFPRKLVEKSLLAGCPIEVCKHCGMTRVRITKQGEFIKTGGKRIKDTPAISEKAKKEGTGYHLNETIGWTDCQCEGEDKYEPGIIIDPFAGSGTVGVEAEKLGRSSILIDIKKDYCEMAYQRLLREVGQLRIGREPSKIEKVGF